MRAVLVDTGGFVALLDRSDSGHGAVVAALKKLHEPLVTVWPAVVEAMHLLSFSWEAQMALWEILESGRVSLLPIGKPDFPRMRALMAKYRDLPMDPADAALVCVAEREQLDQIITLDQTDFRIYRLPKQKSFVLIP